ncbi:AIPR family protein [Bradyrhizobium sp. STM 3843]|uniref:AIPR family protein n=1 Tax=Bradyrhizobium sp. STM 3843 TaxID=551947 RepID=UPI0002EFDD6C|nr:AIPR family protein [Bradyrhizobium sp. STM 3843]
MSIRQVSFPKNGPTLLDWSLIEKGITTRSDFSRSREHAFHCYLLENVFNILPDAADDYIIDGGRDRGVDFIIIDHEARSIDIASTKVVATYKKSQNNFPGATIDKIISFVDDLLHRRDGLLADSNPLLRLKVEEIWDALEHDTYQIRVHLFSNQKPLASAERQRLEAHLARNDISLFESHLYELSHGVVRASKPRFSKTIRATADNSFEYREPSARAVIARLTLSELYDFLNVPANNEFDNRLVTQNVRYYLGSRAPVNREIRDTLVSGRAGEFSLLNNGMTIVCDQMIMVPGGCFPIKLVNPQIVNGGQTAVVIHTVGRSPPAHFSEGSINVKVIETSDRELIERIAVGSNTQNRIFGRDLRANDDIQLRIASSLSAYGYFYRRKRGEQPPQNSMRIIDAIRAGQLILSYANGEPTRAKTDTNEIFGELYETIFNPNKVTAELIRAAYVCFERIQDEKRIALAYQRQITRRSFEEAWIIEGAFHVLFIVGELVRRKGLDLADAQVALNEIDQAFEIVAQLVQLHPKTSSYRLFRLSSSKEHLLNLMPTLHGRPSAPRQMSLPL